MIASAYEDKKIDAVMTVLIKGVPIAQTVANYLNVPFVIVRRDSKSTEGSFQGSSSRVEKMELSKRTLASGSNIRRLLKNWPLQSTVCVALSKI